VLWITSNSTVKKKSDDFAAAKCATDPGPNKAACDSIASDGNSAKSTRTVGVVIAGVGVAAVGAGLAWYFLGGGSEKKTSKLTVTPGPTFAGLGLAGQF
jgi:hypothetical protein